MKLDDAQKIINDYGRILETTASSGLLAVPEYLLPHSKESIKEAIKKMLLVASDPKVASALAASYCDLAKFVSSAAAREVEDWPSAKRAGHTDDELKRRERAVCILNKITDEMETLLEEIQPFAEFIQK